MKTVAIIQTTIKQYRLPFFQRLAESLSKHDITLRVVYGQPTEAECSKGDEAAIAPPTGITVKNRWLMGERLLYQPVHRHIKKADLVVVEQANRNLANYRLLADSLRGRHKFAFWGHGWDHQSTQQGFSARLKRRMLNLPNWWFSYTEEVKNYLVHQGVDPNQITNVQNSIDVAEFRASLNAVQQPTLLKTQSRLGLSPSSVVGLYCGALYAMKRLDFLLQACVQIRSVVPDFHLLVIGDGPERARLEQAAKQYSWVHYQGACFGAEKALYYRLADVVLNPGMVGLAILDAFTAGLPLLTTHLPIHSPEIDYLEDGVNGLITPASPELYAAAVVNLLTNKADLGRLQAAALESSHQYSLDAMVERFTDGIIRCLDKPR